MFITNIYHLTITNLKSIYILIYTLCSTMELSPLDEATFAHPLKKFQKFIFLLSIELF
jgi:hypothetical protein